MKSSIFKKFFWILISAVLTGLCGCVHTVPLEVKPKGDIARVFEVRNKIPANAGIYFSPELKNYVYKQDKMGMTFQMEVGKYFVPIGTQMAEAMFNKVILVDSLPPYRGSYKPDVEGVLEPEIIYAYGDAIGTLSGNIVVKLTVRLRAYDLNGNVIWQRDVTGESQSEKMDFVSQFLGGMGKIGEAGYNAGFQAAEKFLKEYDANPPKEVLSLVELKELTALKRDWKLPPGEAYSKFCQKGVFQYEKKNFQQALYSLEQAEKIKANDPYVNFYAGACYAYTAQKNKAVQDFNKALQHSEDDELIENSEKWLKTLKTPLNIGLVFLKEQDGNPPSEWIKIISQRLADSGMYTVSETKETSPSFLTNKTEFDNYLSNCLKKGLRIVVCISIKSASQKAVAADIGKGDVATEMLVYINAKAYSTKKKNLHSESGWVESTARLGEVPKPQMETIQTQLIKTGADKMVLKLLAKEII
jgi:tetratricopeptide (TPR) repeat protein